jgi:signal transduction histidine kinase
LGAVPARPGRGNAGDYLPPAQVGDSANWLYVQIAALLVITAWAFRPVTATILVAAVCGSYYLGAAVVAPTPDDATGLVEASWALAGIAVVWGAGLRVVVWRVSRTDQALASAAVADGIELAALDIARDRREQERLLHDTVLNTLTALARGTASPAAAAERCRDDVDRVRRLLTGDPLPLTGGLVPAIRELLGGLPAGAGPTLELVVDADPSAGPAGTDPPRTPAQVVSALTGGTAEALRNAVRHGHASWVLVRIRERASGVSVLVQDDGVGFDPARVGPERLGLRRSIDERVTDIGGWVDVRSAPGLGTRIDMTWPAP